MFTRQDYKAIAEMVKIGTEKHKADGLGSLLCDEVRKGLSIELADCFANRDHRFDRERFLLACGIEPPPEYHECGSCGDYHRASFTGDCRDDVNRFSHERLMGMSVSAANIISIDWRTE